MENSRKEILQYLIDRSLEVGIAPVRDAASQFLKLGLKAGVEREKRRPVPKEWLQSAFIKQSGKCLDCKREILLSECEADHVVAISLGGVHAKSNIAARCRKCNREKSNHDLVTHSKKTGLPMNEMFTPEERKA